LVLASVGRLGSITVISLLCAALLSTGLGRSAAWGWQPAYRVSGPTGANGGAALGIDRDGNAVAAWSAMSCAGRSSCLRVAVLRARQTSWGPPQLISRAAFGDRPTVGTDPRGHALVVWAALSETSVWTIVTTRYVGGRWLRPRVLRRMPEGRQPISSELVSSRSGRAVLAWTNATTHDGGAPAFVEAALRLRNGRWLAPRRLSADRGRSPRPAVDRAGNAVVVWTQACAERWCVQAAWLGANSRIWRRGVLGVGRDPSVGVDGRGNFIAAWTSPAGIQVALRRTGTNRWEPPRTVASAYPLHGPDLAVGRRGSAALVWERDVPGLASSIEATRLSSPTGEWEPPRMLSGTAALSPEVAADAQGNVFVAWEHWGRSQVQSSAIEATVRPATSSTWPPANEVSPDNGTRRVVSEVVARGHGRALVTWSSWQAGVEVAAFDGR
jgi:hypothetical protein